MSDLPYAGALFRRVEEQTNEIELLIFVTPELFDAMDAEEVPPCGPGMRTTSPNDVQLGLRGHVEVPRCCPQGPPGMIPGQPGQIVPPDPMLPADGIVPADGILPPGQIVPPEQRLTPGPSEPPAPLPSAPVPSAKKSAFAPPQGKKPSARQGDRPVAATSDRAAELPGFMGPIGYELAD